MSTITPMLINAKTRANPIDCPKWGLDVVFIFVAPLLSNLFLEFFLTKKELIEIKEQGSTLKR
jgi:hypothetical protein